MLNLETLLKNSLIEMGYKMENISFQKPKNEKFGDLSTPVAMQIAKKHSKNPMEVANQIMANIPDNEIIEKIEVINPGFINLFLYKDVNFKNALKLVSNEKFLRDLINQKSDKEYTGTVLIEHTHVNPSKSVHIGHLRNTCIGDSIHRFLDFLNISNKTLYYQNDVGMQVSALVLAREKDLNSSDEYRNMLDWADKTYSQISKMIEDDKNLEEERKKIQQEMFKFDNKYWEAASTSSTKILEEILDYLTTIDVNFNFIIKESDVLRFNLWEKTFESLKKNDKFYLAKSGEKEGCYLIKMDDKDDKIIVRSNGVATYVANDIALHLWKFGLLEDFNYSNFELSDSHVLPISSLEKNIEYKNDNVKTVINVIGNEQSYPQEVVKKSLKALGYENQSENLIHLNYGFVYLSTDSCKELGLPFKESDKRVKISGRAGTVLKAQDFLKILEEKLKANFPGSSSSEKIALFTAKYELLKVDTYKDIVFDLQRACELKGNTGSYILYSYARSKGVLSKSQKDPTLLKLNSALINEQMNLLVNEINQLPDVLSKFKNTLSPSILCNYLQNLSMMYNSFYSNNRIIDSEIENEGLFVSYIFSEVSRLICNLLGLELLNKM